MEGNSGVTGGGGFFEGDAFHGDGNRRVQGGMAEASPGVSGCVTGTPEECSSLSAIGGGRGLWAAKDGLATGRFVDAHLELKGRNSVIGRSIVVLGSAQDANERVAHCVLGVARQLQQNQRPFVPGDDMDNGRP